jgi:hypothetical protein
MGFMRIIVLSLMKAFTDKITIPNNLCVDSFPHTISVK